MLLMTFPTLHYRTKVLDVSSAYVLVGRAFAKSPEEKMKSAGIVDGKKATGFRHIEEGC